MASSLEFWLSRSVVTRFRVNQRQIVVGRRLSWVHRDDFLELHDRIPESAAHCQENRLDSQRR